MTLVSLAIDYKKADTSIRSAYALEGELLPRYLDGLNAQPGVLQSMILSTCNRTELYVVLRELRDLDAVIHWWQNQAKLDNYDLKKFLIIRQESQVARHLMRLACGLESMVLGEPQILGQIKHAYATAMQVGTLGAELNRMCQKVFSLAKQVRHKTDIGRCPVSVAFSAVNLAKKSLDSLSDKTVLILGAGATGTLVTRHLASCNPRRIWVMSRTLKRAETLATTQKAEAYPLTQLKMRVQKADIIVAAISSPMPLINAKMLFGRTKHCILVDLSIPQAISPCIDTLPHVTAYSVDDIEGMIKDNRHLREKAALIAEKWIEKGLEEYINQEKAIRSDHLIIAMRAQAHNMINHELQRSLKRLENGEDPKLVLARFAHSINNKWTHAPSVSLRNAVIEGRKEVLVHAEEIFGLKNGNTKA